ncbi:MAG: polysaccharide pyruvyl transferase family protein, partial [Thiobacillus sp.]
NEPAAAAAWAARQLGTARSMPYVVGRDALAPGGKLIFNAVGGVEWNGLPVALRDDVKAALRQADWLSVRDHVTQAALRAEGIDAPLCSDPAVMVAECFGETIRQHQNTGPVKAIRDAFPQGYLACQFSADFADDASLDALALGLSKVAAATGLGLALFRAGAAPWHDDPALYESLQRRLLPGTAQLFSSLHLWDICALIAASRGTVGSSLHGRIVALAYGLPRVSLIPPQQGPRPDKRTAFAETWEPDAVPRSVAVDRIEPAVLQALAVPADVLRDNAAQLCARYLQSQAQWAGLLRP